jgi:hypothetical protein
MDGVGGGLFSPPASAFEHFVVSYSFSFLLFGSSSMRGSYLYLYIWRLSPYFRFWLLLFRLCTGVGGGGGSGGGGVEKE